MKGHSTHACTPHVTVHLRESVTLKILGDFGKISGLLLNIKKTKAIWLGKWANNKSCPLGMKWLHTPVKILGIHFSYDDKGNSVFNFNHKVERLQTKLNMWSGRDLTLFGKVMIIKTLGLSKLFYFASNLFVPDGIAGTVRTKSFKFLWKNKKEKELAFIRTQTKAD